MTHPRDAAEAAGKRGPSDDRSIALRMLEAGERGKAMIPPAVDPLHGCEGYRCDWQTSPKRLCPLHAQAGKLREALRVLYEETADYIKINNLGDVHQNQSMQMARTILKATEPTP